MQLREIIDCCSHLVVVEKRCQTEDLIEFVILDKDIKEWHRIISAFLGSPIKAEGQIPSDNDLELTSRTGGIRIEQTLYEKEFEGSVILAKLWPWKDKKHTTLRMALLVK